MNQNLNITTATSGREIGALLHQFRAPEAKVQNMAKAGELVRLRRDLYIGSHLDSYDTLLIANKILSPSYVSGITALWYYDIIPETVFDMISMTPKRGRIFRNQLGEFKYIQCPEYYYVLGVNRIESNGTTLLIASPEKALCDFVAMSPNLTLRYRKEAAVWMIEEMRFDEDELRKMDTSSIRKYASLWKKGESMETIAKVIELWQ